METLILPIVLKWRPPVLVRYIATTILVGITFALRFVSGQHLEHFQTVIFFPAIVLASLLFGRPSGLFAAALSAALMDYFFLDPRGSLRVRPDEIVPLLVFIAVSVMIASVTEALRHALERVAAAEREKSMLLDELAHRTKNDFMMIASMLRLQAQRRPEPARTDLNAAAARVQALAQVHDRLQRHDGQTVIDAREYLEGLCSALSGTFREVRAIAVRVTSEPIKLNIASTVPIGLIVNELVTNSLKYAFPKGRSGAIDVALRMADAETVEIVVRDDGIGCPATAQEGLGSQLVRSFAQQMNGTVTREAVNPGCQTTVRVRPRPQ